MDDRSLFKLYNLRVKVGRNLGGDVWCQVASRGLLSMKNSSEPEAKFPVFGNVQAAKGCSSRRDPTFKGLSACKRCCMGDFMVFNFCTRFL